MKSNFKIILEYDGGLFHGWQRQKNAATVQAEIEKALFTLTGENIVLTGSGRTDAGVHALGQAANFISSTPLTSEVIQRALNSLVPEGIVITSCSRVNEKFHARYDAKSKTYHYRILNRAIPAVIGRQYAWFIRPKLNIGAMQEAAGHLLGSQDFKAFEGTGSPRSHTIRQVMTANLTHDGDYLIFEIRADGFLRFMVRNIVGTLVDVGLGRIGPDDFKRILLSKDRAQAGATAPPHGLFLVEVEYA